MKNSALIFCSFLFSGTAAAADFSAVPSGTYNVDPTHAYINFQYNYFGLSNPVLQFDELTLSMDLDTAEPANTTVTMEIVANSVVTGSDIWHEHITGEKWFDTAKYPTLNFSSTEVTANDDGTYNVAGDLTVKDVTSPVVLKVTVNAAIEHPIAKKPVVGISAVGGLKRSDWDLGGSVPFVSDEVKLEVQAEMFAAQ